ncbi:tyrosine-type recombinase/integrase [Wielerella bovis]|uniref:tyrosine-type recombinase/integrase n=1 Tax=Wielerella bovis TaxID=2917790 RepID=UPI002018D5C3|nr:integrase arm-type DNA-binding domain-containing protein [Wielerella bovis]MCG7657328.1 Arm DNA-binding domain-containing protein [Wielerella bovis]MCG7659550.1 Arm DNA-binding domain-containing protein [Wielerella bovis]
MKLNDQQIKKAKPKEKPYKLADGKGLYLYITPTGGKLWRLKYRVDGKEKTLSIGAYPTITLAQAREQTAIAHQQQANGIDPSQAKQQAKAEKKQAALNTFQAVMLQWHTHNLSRWKPNHAARVMRYFENDVLPLIGNKQIDSLRVADIRTVLDNIKERGVNETAEKIRQWIGAVFKYANQI